MSLWLTLAGLNGAIAVAAGAVGAHALKARVDARQLDWFTQAADYQLWHALALLGVAAVHLAGSGSGLASAAGWFFQIGILLFCGTLYWLGVNGAGSLGPLHWLTPVGGLGLIVGWILIAAAGVRGLA